MDETSEKIADCYRPQADFDTSYRTDKAAIWPIVPPQPVQMLVLEFRPKCFAWRRRLSSTLQSFLIKI